MTSSAQKQYLAAAVVEAVVAAVVVAAVVAADLSWSCIGIYPEQCTVYTLREGINKKKYVLVENFH